MKLSVTLNRFYSKLIKEKAYQDIKSNEYGHWWQLVIQQNIIILYVFVAKQKVVSFGWLVFGFILFQYQRKDTFSSLVEKLFGWQILIVNDDTFLYNERIEKRKMSKNWYFAHITMISLHNGIWLIYETLVNKQDWKLAAKDRSLEKFESLQIMHVQQLVEM